MRYVGLVIICAAIAAAGLNAAAENGKKIALLNTLSRMLTFVAGTINTYGAGFAQTLSRTADVSEYDCFSFHKNAVNAFAKSTDMTAEWKAAVDSDLNLKKLGAECIKALESLSLCFGETSPAVFAKVCSELARGYEEKRDELIRKRSAEEKLTVSGAFLGAAAVFIIFI